MIRRKGGAVLKLKGVNTIGEAEALAGAEILVPDDTLRPLDGGRHYVADLIGCAVSVLDGRPVGIVVDVWDAGGSAVLVVKRPPDDAEVLIPLSASICPAIDTAAKSITIDPPDGLLDLNEI